MKPKREAPVDIHPDQANERQLYEMADFLDSGYQSFVQQVKLAPKQLTPGAFMAGASLVLKLLEHFRTSGYTEADERFLTGLLVHEVNDYMNKNKLRLEWEPHVPSRWQQ